MALPKVEVGHVFDAIIEIAKTGVPIGRSARKYALVADKDELLELDNDLEIEEGKHSFPPKYVYCVAVKFATDSDEPLSPDGFSATEAIARLRALGFVVEEKEVS